MKIRNLVLGIMTCAAFTACTNDEIGDNNVDQLEGDAFVAVNIVSNSSAGSRALGDVVAGSNDENKVNEAIFFFFDAAGNGCADPATPTLDFTTAAGQPSTISKAVLVLKNAKSIPASIVAVMNPSSEIKALGMSTSLATLRTTVAKVTAVGNFIMSNSAYAVNGTLVDATPIGASNICQTEPDALKNPVNIPVERVVAKINTTLANAIMSEEKFLIDGVETSITVKLLGWKVTDLNPESNLIKNVDPTWTMNWWNDAANFRSFWGISKAATTFTHFNHTDIAANNAPEYCLENTNTTKTKLIVAAQLQTAAGAPIDLMEWKGAKNTKENMKVILANTSDVKKYYTKDADGVFTSLDAKYIDFTTVGTSEDTRYTVIAKLIADAPQVYTVTNKVGNAVTADVVNATLKGLGEIKHWNKGASYFYTDIEHNGGEGLGSVGIIRNHSYVLTVTAVTGLGTPVPDQEEIIPEKPKTDEETYIAATVEVLDWKIVKQEVALTDK